MNNENNENNEKPKLVIITKSKDIPDLYQVKYRVKKEYEHLAISNEYLGWKYGIVDQYSQKAKQAWKMGALYISDAITPQAWTIECNYYEIWDIPMSFSPPDEYMAFVESEFVKAQKVDKKAKTEKKMVGKMLRKGVGDGCAFYIVTKETSKNATIEWRCFQGDRYVDSFLGYGGTFPKNRIERFVE